MTNPKTIKIHDLWKNVYRPKLAKWVKSGENLQLGSITELRDFVNYFDGRKVTKKAVNELVYSAKFQTSFKTAKREKKRLEEFSVTDTGVKFKDIKKMSTREFADLIKVDIRERYKQDLANGLSSQEAKADISNYFFGS